MVAQNMQCNPYIVYVEILYCCKNGGQKFKSAVTGKRNETQTHKTGCAYRIKLKATIDGQMLEVVEHQQNHNDYDKPLTNIIQNNVGCVQTTQIK